MEKNWKFVYHCLVLLKQKKTHKHFYVSRCDIDVKNNTLVFECKVVLKIFSQSTRRTSVDFWFSINKRLHFFPLKIIYIEDICVHVCDIRYARCNCSPVKIQGTAFVYSAISIGRNNAFTLLCCVISNKLRA